MNGMREITAIRESILNAKDEKDFKRMVEIADLMAGLDEVPEATKRRWKLAEKRASKRLQRARESGAAKAKKGKEKPNTTKR